MSGVLGGLIGSTVTSGPDFELIQTVNITSNTANVVFSSIPQAYRHLQLRVVARTTTGGSFDTQLMYLNSDTTPSYSYHRLSGLGGTISSGGFPNQSVAYLGWAAGTDATSQYFAPTLCDILDYKSSSKNKTLRVFEQFVGNVSAPTSGIRSSSVGWYKTNPITSLTIFTSGSYVAGTRISLYGIRG